MAISSLSPALHGPVRGCAAASHCDLFDQTTLVHVHAKRGSMVDARHAFDMLPHCNVVTWNLMILGYAQRQEEAEMGLELYAQMVQEGVAPTERTFVGALKACCSLAALEEGREGDGGMVKLRCLEKGRSIHFQVVKGAFETNAYVATALMDMYIKCGRMEDAWHLFQRLPHRDVGPWTAIILGYADRQQGKLALQLYARMQDEGVVPNERTFVGALKACAGLAKEVKSDCEAAKMQWLVKCRAIHCQIVKAGVEWNVYVGNTLMDVYAHCGSMVDARHVFDELGCRNVVSWNVMIQGYAQNEEGAVALQLYARMLQEGIAPDDRTFVCVLQACISLASLEQGTEVGGVFVKKECLGKGRAVHCFIVKGGFEANLFVGNTLINMYAKCGSMVDARHVFDRLPRRDVISWTAMLLGYAERRESEGAFLIYAQLLEQGLSADGVTFVSILKVCGDAAALQVGREIHRQICRAGVETADVTVANALIDMYAKCGSMFDAQQVFDALSVRDLLTWGVLIAGYARQGENEAVFDLFERMMQEGVLPDRLAFLSVLTACSHAGLVHKGQEYFDSMTKEHRFTPTIEHYNCMVDLLGRAGQLDEALAVVEKMPFRPTLATYTSVLAACRKWADVKVGRLAFECAVRLDESHAAAYILMSNIYADAHMFEECDEIYAMRENVRAWKKEPGQSWWTDQVQGKVHSFVAGDNKHPQSKHIYAKLKHLSVMMKDDNARQ